MAVKKVESLKAMKIGVDDVVACYIEDTFDTYAPAGEVIALPGAMTLNVNANMSMETAFYDNGPGEVASTLGVIEVTFNKSALGTKEKAFLLGLKAVEGEEKVLYTQSDIAPWIALGFRSLKSDGTYRYAWLLKGKFTIPADNNETKADSINFQSEELTGRFVSTNYEFPVKVEDSTTLAPKKLWKLEMDEAMVSEISDETKKASALLQVKGWEAILSTIEKSTEGKTYVEAATVKVQKPDGTEIGASGLEIEAADRGKVFQVKGFAQPAATRAGEDKTCIQAFEYWECKGAADYSAPDTASFNYYGNGRFKFQEQTASAQVDGYIACKAIHGTDAAKKIIKVTGKASSKTVV